MMKNRHITESRAYHLTANSMHHVLEIGYAIGFDDAREVAVTGVQYSCKENFGETQRNWSIKNKTRWSGSLTIISEVPTRCYVFIDVWFDQV